MRTRFIAIGVVSLILSCALIMRPAVAQNFSNGVQVKFDWRTVWGDINFSGGADTLIPSTQLQAKADIKSAVGTCGTDTSKVGLIKTYNVDINSDGKQDIITDASGYFKTYMNSNCALQICDASDGCYLSIYVTTDPTDLIAQPAANAPACPAKPEDNTTCIASCAATQSNCPGLFQYNMRAAYNQRVFAWSFMAPDDFETWTSGSPSTATSYKLVNANPVLVVKLNNSICYNDELSMNNNECVKYYQYSPSDYSSGVFVDLYNFQAGTSAAYDTRFTYTPFNRATAHLARGTAYGSGFGHQLSANGGTLDIQLSSFERTNANGTVSPAGFNSFHIVNNSSRALFIPSNSDKEFSSFLNAASSLGASVGPEELQFTAWVGDTSCPDVVLTPTSIAAQRLCISSTSDYRSCSSCTAAASAAGGVGWPSDWQQGCSISQQCAVNACVLTPQYVDSVGGNTSYVGSATTLDQCLNPQNYANDFWSTVPFSQRWGDPNSGWPQFSYPDWCNITFQELCAGGIDCIASGTMIRMADGSQRNIEDLKPGDLVAGFKDPKDSLNSYKVKLVAVTPEQKLLSINGELNLSMSHKVMMANGYPMQASSLKVGDVVLRDDGTELKVKSIDAVPMSSTVYNLKLDDDGAGFVANGIRVIEYSK